MYLVFKKINLSNLSRDLPL